jgi:D-glycero-alpha-D-manno-heptose-7-phosphate kinase
MIGTCTPFRISFVGGGSDMKSFYSRHPGAVVSTTINKYMYIFLHPFFDNRIQIKYSKTELVDSISQIEHPIVRTVLKEFNVTGIDINSIADIPAGTGLGSSCSFTVGLLYALYSYISRFASKELLARKACEIEIDLLEEPIGKQDQYAVAFGGLNLMTFHPNEEVTVEPIVMQADKQKQLKENLMMFYLGKHRSTRDILKEQKQNVESNRDNVDMLIRMAALAQNLRRSLSEGNVDDMGLVLDENWQLKKRLSSKITTPEIDGYYTKAKKAGALGGKLLGAGGGGFMLFYCKKEAQESVRKALENLREFPFAFENHGTHLFSYENQTR